jgi:diguanylate cyclase (GGDEF)-like protein/PAS domain S-box-containing protein
MIGYLIAGLAYLAITATIERFGVTSELAAFISLCLVSPIPTAISTASIMHLTALKRGGRLHFRAWSDAAAWLIAMAICAGLVAGIVTINARYFGPVILLTAALVVGALIFIARFTLSRTEAERQAQEALVASAQHEADLSQKRFTASFTNAAIGMAIARPDGPVLQVNRALCDLTGRSEADVVGEPFASLLHAGDATLLRRQADQVLARPEEAFSMELRVIGADSADIWVALHCAQFADPSGSGHALIYQLHDITSRHLAEKRLQHIAYHDDLTNLANRNCFHERLEVAVERSTNDPSARFTVLFLDLDRFKLVNDSMGHMAGNLLLAEVARRLLACARTNDLVARLGGDEFAILIEDSLDIDAGMRLAQRVLEALKLPTTLNNTELVPAASIGITTSDLGYRTVDEVLRDADLAMYEAKAAGRCRVAYFDSSMHSRAAEKLSLETELRRAISDGALSVHYQPLYELSPYRLVGFEALARWTHPRRGSVSPVTFIKLAEVSGQIDALTDFVIERAIAQLAAWQRLAPAMPLTMHVNISGRDLARKTLPGHVLHTLQRNGVAPRTLTLEITETTLMQRVDEALETMNRMRESGVRFSIDDFGTGYSSLAYLSTLPIDSLKVDRSFVTGIIEKPQNAEIVRAVVTLGQALGRRVIAEGIETQEQLSRLLSLGVNVGQGFLLSRPLPAERAEALISAGEAAFRPH